MSPAGFTAWLPPVPRNCLLLAILVGRTAPAHPVPSHTILDPQATSAPVDTAPVRLTMGLLHQLAPLWTDTTPLTVPVIPVERYTLPNGLTVLLSEDHTAPVVAVYVRYHVGHTNVPRGRTGLDGFCQGLMHQGTQHFPDGARRTIKNVGGAASDMGEADRTNFIDSLPSNQLATALWLESDRMGFHLPALDQAKLDAVRDHWKRARHERWDNQPYVTWEVLMQALFPPTNPYSWSIIGSVADLSATSLADVQRFCSTNYTPNNATLAVVGDFDSAAAKVLIAKYFGPIPRGPALVRPVVQPVTLHTVKRLVLEDDQATAPQLTIAWPAVGLRYTPDHLALGALGWVLTGDRTSRLTQLLVDDRQLATSVSAGDEDALDNENFFRIIITARPTASLTEIERLVDSTLTTLTTTPPTAQEMDRFKHDTRVQSVLPLDSAMNRAELLQNGETYYHDPLAYITVTKQELALTPGAVARVARRYLTPGRVVLSIVPAGKLNQIAQPDAPYMNVTPPPDVPPAAAPHATPAR